MAETVPFRLKLTGSTADHHQFQGYDGYMALAGFAWTLSLVSNYADTGKIRQRGEFDGRQAVRATAPREGSVIADFFVYLQNNPAQAFGVTTVGSVSCSVLLYSLFNRVINRNLGQEDSKSDAAISQLLHSRGGDIEALVAISEAPIRQAHSVIGNGADKMLITGGFNILNTFDHETRDYVRLNVEDRTKMQKDVSVSAFNANSGYGSVFDSDLGHVVPITMHRETLRRLKGVFSWGLDQYARGTGARITMEFTRVLAMDGRPKRYVVLNASHK